MKYRKGIQIKEASEEEMLRWQMEHIIEEMPNIDEGQLGKCSEALAKLYESLKNRHTRLLFRITISLYLVIGLLIFVKELFWSKR